MQVIFDGVRALIRREYAGLEQAGAIVVRGSGPTRRILLVTNKEGDRWIFPKGTIKKSETAEEAAQREAEEEAGVRGRLLAYVGATVSADEDDEVRVNYFLLRAVGQQGEGEEGRGRKWCTPEETLELLSWPALRQLIEKALPEIMQFE
jgi:8-oxo-dGTP pyrophosphatase MutT (NUDIX family)